MRSYKLTFGRFVQELALFLFVLLFGALAWISHLAGSSGRMYAFLAVMIAFGVLVFVLAAKWRREDRTPTP